MLRYKEAIVNVKYNSLNIQKNFPYYIEKSRHAYLSSTNNRKDNLV